MQEEIQIQEEQDQQCYIKVQKQIQEQVLHHVKESKEVKELSKKGKKKSKKGKKSRSRSRKCSSHSRKGNKFNSHSRKETKAHHSY